MSSVSPYEQFAAMMLHEDSRYIPAILKVMINDEQARLMVSLPGTVDEMAAKLGRPADTIAADLKDMFRKGLAFKREKNGVTTWRACAHLAQFHDASILWPEAPPEFYELWRLYMEKEWPELAANLAKLLPRPFARVIPVGKSVPTGKVQVLAPENVRQIVADSSRIAVTQCTCRLTMKQCDAPVEVCLQINKGADYTIERGSGREITKDEALSVIEAAEEAGLVHVTMNKADVGHFICNCCGCCCQSFTLLISDGIPLCDPSRYRPRIDAEACTACGSCEDRCWFGAISLEEDAVVVDGDKCLGCGQCAVGCPAEAIVMEAVRDSDFIPG